MVVAACGGSNGGGRSGRVGENHNLAKRGRERRGRKKEQQRKAWIGSDSGGLTRAEGVDRKRQRRVNEGGGILIPSVWWGVGVRPRHVA